MIKEEVVCIEIEALVPKQQQQQEEEELHQHHPNPSPNQQINDGVFEKINNTYLLE
jgi:hypothetical protein